MAVEAPDLVPNRLGAFIGEVTFLPADTPRESAFALWQPMPGFGARSRVRLAVRDAEGVIRFEEVAAALVTAAAAIPWLAQSRERGTASFLAWRSVVRAGLALVARGRLRPSISPTGHDCWAAAAFEDDEMSLLSALAAALPAEAHAVPLPHEASRIRSPEASVRACWDAIADALPRTAAAASAYGGPLYSEWAPGNAVHLAPSVIPGRGLKPGLVRLRVDLDPEGDVRLIQASEGEPPYEALVALHRGARYWDPLRRLAATGSATITGKEFDALESTRQHLSRAGVGVALPETEPLRLRAVVGDGRRAAGAPAFTLDALLDFDWELAAGSDRLTAAEVEELARSQRRFVRHRDRWLSVDPELLELVRNAPIRRLRAGEALAAVLTGTVNVGGKVLAVRATGGLEALRKRLRKVEGPREEHEPPGLEASLRAYQRRGLAWLSDMCELGLGGCLADDMGLGKTIQVIALHLTRPGGVTLVVCPASLLGNWERELRTFAPAVPVRRYHGGGRRLNGLAANEVVLTTYGVVRTDVTRLNAVAWDLVVADEAQHVKNPTSAGARELRRLGARARIALTGTPVENSVLDLWAILDWTTPGLLGSREGFAAWTRPVELGDEERTEGLRRLVAPFLLRRRKSDPGVAPELPPKTESDHLVALTREQVGLYEAVVRETMAAIRASEGIQRRGLVLKLITQLKQICNHPAQFLREEGPLAGRSGKLEALEELLDVVLAEGESALVFTQYVGMGTLLMRHLADRCPVAFLHGGVPVRRRDEMVRRFQSADVRVLLVSLRAGGFGLNLARATHVMHFDRWWNPAVEDQATDRAHRIGQDRPVQVHRLVTEGTVEDRIAGLLKRKRDLAGRVTSSGEAWVSELSDKELGLLVQLQRTS